MEKITWKNPGYYKGVSAKKVNDELNSLESVTPASIVEKARDENTELHSCFEWDDSIAAQKHREQQARMILVNLVVVHEDPKKKEKTNVRLFVNNVRGQEYKPISFVVKNRSEYELLLERARKELIAFTKKYNSLSEYKELCEYITNFIR